MRHVHPADPLNKRDAAAPASKRPKVEPGSSVVIGTNAPLPKVHALSKSALWLERYKSLLVSGRVWDVAKLAPPWASLPLSPAHP